jgi:predicted CXXCH cytochrome family protein
MKRLSKLFTVLAIATVVVMLRAPAWAETAPGGGMLGSTHDWSITGGHPSKFVGKFDTGVGMCSYCHTPHHALSTLLLWNQKLSTNTFSWDVPSTTAGTTFPTFTGNTYMGPTAKCLSCHDGSVAVGDFNNYQEIGELWGTPNTLATHKISGGDQIAGDISQAGSIQAANGSRGNFAGNHPVAMPYPYQQALNTYNTVTNGAATNLLQFQSTPVSPVILYNDDGLQHITAGAVTGKSGIECTSCHDPHNSVGQVVDGFLLRGSLVGSDTTYICLKCHIK